MEVQIPVAPTEVLELYQDGVRKGFIAGVIFCVVANHIYRRNKEFKYAKQSPRLIP